jgi:hypothetical protein
VIPQDPRIKREGEGLGREGIGVWPTQKLSRGAPYVLASYNNTANGVELPELTMGQLVMGQMGRLKLMGHMGHGSEGVDP